MQDRLELLEMTTDIVVAYVSKNTIPATEVGPLIMRVHSSLGDLEKNGSVGSEPRPEPAVPIKKSITPDYLICLEDGRQFKSLKRHLRTKYGMSPDEYRAKWGLKPDYPMVAPSYRARRSELAREMGLGRRGDQSES